MAIGKYINQGLLPYRDLFDHKPPAIYFLFALLFKVFGPNLWVAKILLIISTIGAAVLIKKIGELLKPGTGWYSAIIFLFLMTQFEGNRLIAEPFMLLPLLLSLWLLLRSNQDRRLIFIAGLSLSIAVLFKQTAILSALPIVVLAFISIKKQLPVFVVGLAVPWLLLGTYLLLNDLLAEAWRQVVVLNFTSYPREPLGYVLQYLLLIFLWTLPVWILAIIGWPRLAQYKKTILALLLLPLPFMFIRHYPHYWVQLLPFVAIVAAAGLVGLRQLKWLVPATMVFCLTIAGGKIGRDASVNYQKLQAQFNAARMIEADSRLRGNDSATKVLAENQFTAFYFLLPGQPLNKYLYLTEITAPDKAEQQTIIDLQNNPSTLILWPIDPQFAYAKHLQNFILNTTVEARTFHDLDMKVLMRK